MLPQAIIDEAMRLIATGLSQRKVASQLGISRGVVGDLASGKRQPHGRDDSPSKLQPRVVQPLRRCKKCGMTVSFPCVACRAKLYRDCKRAEAALHA